MEIVLPKLAILPLDVKQKTLVATMIILVQMMVATRTPAAGTQA